MAKSKRSTHWLCVLGLAALMVGAFSSRASATAVISLTAMTNCMTPNGHGGDWCASNGQPFNITSFTTQSIGPAQTTGSSAFFAIKNNTLSTVTTLTLDFVGTFTDPSAPFAQCGGGASGIQGSGPGSSGTTTCTVTPDGTGAHPFTNGFSVTWNGLTWVSGATFDLQIASFSAVGTNGTFQTSPSSPTPEPGTLGLIGIGLVFVGAGIRRWERAGLACSSRDWLGLQPNGTQTRKN